MSGDHWDHHKWIIAQESHHNKAGLLDQWRRERLGEGWDEACIQILTKGRGARTALLLIWIYTLPDTKEELLLQEGRRGSLFQSPLPLDNKTVAHWILGPEPPCLPACISHKHPILISLFLAHYFVSRWIPSAWSHKNLNLSKSRHWVNDSILKLWV